ncbi:MULTISPECIES: SRPBCC family protein [unclassified Novosphingobium]|uniref:aromatic ring-hydroxylating oxygenase subunit alpha n=1 Tax=unclassified Novosphingobium TaxID=2644732 RepID=UPI000F5E5459|nr:MULTISPECIES: SRPBCC family protein [unclassified Novosphingobium]MBF5092837.1 Rieske 2Fe-2S domain-containing protein [Novosphingobium sp. NBM11]RQW44733.1 Rieske (2Fe-2S) protein [Novosphingobium sp. LASN5T]
MSTAPCRFMDRYPEEGRGPIPVERYTSQEYFDLERERVFRRKWLNVGRVEQAPNPGDYFVADLKILDTSLLVIRGKDGEYRAFHNMCSHRGAPVAWDAEGSCRGYLACRFHGWVYDTTGKLVQITDAENFPGVNPAENGLTPVHCAIWKGFIFVNLADRPEQTLLEYLGPVADEIGRFDFDGYTPAFSYRIDEQVNWKTLQEAQLEGWHLPYLHEKTLARAVKIDGNQYRHTAIELHGLHGVLGSPPPDAFTPPPTALLASRFGTGTVQAFGTKVENAGEGYRFRGSFDFWHIFPNFFVGLLNGLFFTFNIWPVAVDRSVWEIKGYYPPVRTAGELFAREYSKIGLRDPMMEDCFTHELICAQLKSGAKNHIFFQDEEMLARHLSNGVDRCVRGLA